MATTKTVAPKIKTPEDIIQAVKNEINYCTKHHSKNLAPHDNYTPAYRLMGKLAEVLDLSSAGFGMLYSTTYEDAGICYAEAELMSKQRHASKTVRTHAQHIMSYLSTHFDNSEALNVKVAKLPKALSKADIMKIFDDFKFATKAVNFDADQQKSVQQIFDAYARHDSVDIQIALNDN